MSKGKPKPIERRREGHGTAYVVVRLLIMWIFIGCISEVPQRLLRLAACQGGFGMSVPRKDRSEMMAVQKRVMTRNVDWDWYEVDITRAGSRPCKQ